MRERITPDLVRLTLWAGCLTYCAGLWVWIKVDQIRHPDEWPTP